MVSTTIIYLKPWGGGWTGMERLSEQGANLKATAITTKTIINSGVYGTLYSGSLSRTNLGRWRMFLWLHKNDHLLWVHVHSDLQAHFPSPPPDDADPGGQSGGGDFTGANILGLKIGGALAKCPDFLDASSNSFCLLRNTQASPISLPRGILPKPHTLLSL